MQVGQAGDAIKHFGKILLGVDKDFTLHFFFQNMCIIYFITEHGLQGADLATRVLLEGLNF